MPDSVKNIESAKDSRLVTRFMGKFLSRSDSLVSLVQFASRFQ
jgi:hypothetical protein